MIAIEPHYRDKTRLCVWADGCEAGHIFCGIIATLSGSFSAAELRQIADHMEAHNGR